MEQTKTHPVLRLAPSLSDIAFILPFLFVFTKLGGAKALLEGDTGWHVRAGEWMLANGRVPDKDLFSFTRPDAPWFAWEWLWDVCFAWLHQRWGMGMVVAVSLILISLVMLVLFRRVLRECGNPLIAIAITWLAAAASSIHWLARPHVVTFFFVLVFAGILEQARRERSYKRFALLPLLTIVWTNLHGGFLAGFVLIAVYFAGEVIRYVIDRQQEGRPFLLAGVGCALASCINPYGIQLHRHLWVYLTSQYHLRHVMEFLSISFQHPAARYLEAMLVLAALAFVYCWRERRYAEALLLVVWAHLALTSARHIPIFVFLAAAPAGRAMQSLIRNRLARQSSSLVDVALGEFQEIAGEVAALERRPRVPALSIAASTLLLVLLVGRAPDPIFVADYDVRRYPEAALTAARAHLTDRLFTSDEWGDFLIYRLYPFAKVFVDGRTDFYGEEFCQNYVDIIDAKFDWEKRLERYDVESVMLPVDLALSTVLKESPRWRVVYDDGVAIVFRRLSGAPAGVTSSAVHEMAAFPVHGE